MVGKGEAESQRNWGDGGRRRPREGEVEGGHARERGTIEGS